MSKPMYMRDSMMHASIMINGFGSTENGGVWESLTASEVRHLGINPATTANEFILSREELIEKIKSNPPQAIFKHEIPQLKEVMYTGICGNISIDFCITIDEYSNKFKKEHEINSTLLLDKIWNWSVIKN